MSDNSKEKHVELLVPNDALAAVKIELEKLDVSVEQEASRDGLGLGVAVLTIVANGLTLTNELLKLKTSLNESSTGSASVRTIDGEEHDLKETSEVELQTILESEIE